MAIAVGACSKGYDLTPTGSGGSGGSGAGAGTGASGATGAGGDGAGGQTTTTTTGAGGAEPTGKTKLTVLNGINDFPAARFCFVPYPDGGVAFPWPSDPLGLAFSKAEVAEPLSEVAPPDTDVLLHVITGDLSLAAGLTCDEILALGGGGAGGSGASGGSGGTGGTGGNGGTGAGEPPSPFLQVTSMVVLPKDAFTSGKSLLLLLDGCLGGPGHEDPTQGLGCGATYTPQTPTAGIALVAMSRKSDPDHVTVQVVHGSAALPQADFRVTPGYDAAIDTPVAKNLATGGLAPKPPFMGLTRVDYGSLPNAMWKAYPPGGDVPFGIFSLGQALDNGGLNHSSFENGKSVVFVAVGGYPGIPAQAFWNEFKYTAILADP